MKLLILAVLAAMIAQPVLAAPAQPLRTIKFEGALRKLKISPADVSHEIVCNVSGELPVYASLEGRETASEGKPQECATKIAGRDTKVRVSGLVFVSSGSSRIAKRAIVSIMIAIHGREPIYLSGSAGVGGFKTQDWSLSLQSQTFRSSKGVNETLFSDLNFRDDQTSVD